MANEDASELSRMLNGARAYIHTLPGLERRVATLAADGMPTWEIALETGMSEGAVARTLDGVVATVSGRPVAKVETGGFGSDTDPGVTGGYGNTGFGAVDTDPPADSSEPMGEPLDQPVDRS
ncbi:MAG: hypothetical protein M3Q29_25835 [Chloroflexota bacterium]|nr:hypothetical protein [Chloroflexota bacterium]